ncbi:toxin [Streptomyces sp. NPDC053427]|uniref:toxin n=1 Tax=Streptomyces sp. NPDC053427 TaxID=3365701 RepID=UPI0037D349CF
MSLRELKRRCEEGLEDLPIPYPFSIEQLRLNMEEARGTSIIFHPIPEYLVSLKTACGLRIGTDDFDVILHRERPTEYQTEHIQLHELTHVWLRHGTKLDAEALAELVPVFQTDLIQRVLEGGATVQARANYRTDEEKIAELAASLIPRMARDVPSDDMLGRLGDTLSRPSGGRELRRFANLFRRS